MESSVELFTRRKQGDATRTGRRKAGASVVLRKQEICKLFAQSQGEAAKQLGISITTLKKVCRKMGIVRWPFSRRSEASKAPASDLRTQPAAHSTAQEAQCNAAELFATATPGQASALAVRHKDMRHS